MSLRKLDYHEKKLLKKSDFLNWKTDTNIREVSILRRYHITKREDYQSYNRIVGQITKLTHRLVRLPQNDSYRIKTSDSLLEKLYSMGLIQTKKSLLQCEKITASAFCRRRLAVILVRLHMAQTLQQSVKLIQHGHIRIGPNLTSDPATLITRSMEDFITWVDSSKIKRTIQSYHDKIDDYTLLGN